MMPPSFLNIYRRHHFWFDSIFLFLFILLRVLFFLWTFLLLLSFVPDWWKTGDKKAPWFSYLFRQSSFVSDAGVCQPVQTIDGKIRFFQGSPGGLELFVFLIGQNVVVDVVVVNGLATGALNSSNPGIDKRSLSRSLPLSLIPIRFRWRINNFLLRPNGMKIRNSRRVRRSGGSVSLMGATPGHVKRDPHRTKLTFV